MEASLLPKTVEKGTSKLGGARKMLLELIASFILILSVSIAIYIFASAAAPKSGRRAQHISTYACGEKVRLGRLHMNVTFYRYLAYFVILDSSIIIAAFASLTLNTAILPYILIYLGAILAATLLLTEGDAGDVAD